MEIGKSLAISRFVADMLETIDPAERPDAVFHVDFDRLSLQQARPSTILQELVRQADRWWISEKSEQLADLLRRLSSGDAELESIGSNIRSHEAIGDAQGLARRLVRLLSVDRPPRIILFVNSFEQVELFDDYAAASPLLVESMLTRWGAKVLSIFAARAFADPGAISQRTPGRLPQFSVEQAETYLRNEAQRSEVLISAGTARRVIDAVGCSPLNLRLAIAVLEKEGGEVRPDGMG